MPRSRAADYTTLRGVLRLLGRGLRLHCPRCGGARILAGWFRLKSECPTCGLALDRGEHDYWLGAYALNLIVAELAAAACIVVIVLATWPDVRWTLVQFGGVALAVATPILFFPFSRVVWLALDLAFRDRG